MHNVQSKKATQQREWERGNWIEKEWEVWLYIVTILMWMFQCDISHVFDSLVFGEGNTQTYKWRGEEK